jgi:hypothetical protein
MGKAEAARRRMTPLSVGMILFHSTFLLKPSLHPIQEEK